MIIVGCSLGLAIGLALLIMVGTQIYNISTDKTPTQILSKHDKREFGREFLKDENSFELVFGETRWMWSLPFKPDNEKYDPHFAYYTEEIMLPDYEELTQNILLFEHQ